METTKSLQQNDGNKKKPETPKKHGNKKKLETLKTWQQKLKTP